MNAVSCSFALLKRRALFLLLFFPSILYSQSSEVIESHSKYFAPDFSVTSPSFYYSPGDTVKLDVLSDQINYPAEFSVQVFSITDPEVFLKKQQYRSRFSVIAKGGSNLLEYLKEVKSFTRTILPKREKNTGRLFIKDLIRYIAGEKGVYMIRVTHKNKSATSGFFVSRLALISRFTENSLLNFATDRITGVPVEGINYSLYFDSVKQGSIFAPGTGGNLFYTSRQKESMRDKNQYPLVVAWKDGEYAVSDPNFYFYGYYQPYSAFIVTNQPVYRPPAKVDFKISLREMSQEGFNIFKGKDAVIRIKQPDGAQIYRKLVNTNEYGSYSDSVNINKDAPLGDYVITVEIREPGDTTDNKKAIYQTFTQAFKVDEYKKPEYKVEVKTDKEQYGGKENIEIEVQSDYYFGSHVQEGDVNYFIYKKPLYRPWWYYSEYSWFYKDYYSVMGLGGNNFENSVLIHSGKGKLDQYGNFKVTYTLDEDFKEGKNKSEYETDYIYIVRAGVVDKSRTNVTSSKDVNVTRSDYFINTQVSRYVCAPGEKIALTVRARDFSDKPVEANYIVSVNRITFEDKKRISTYVDSYSGKTSYLGEDIMFINTDLEGYYELEVASFDSKNTKIADKTGSYVAAGRMTWWDHDPDAVELIPEKDSYFPGDTAVFYFSAPHDSAYLFITAYNSNIISYRTELITGGSDYLKIPIASTSAPNFFANVSYVRNNRIYSATKPVAVIPRNKFLSVELSSDKPVYKPREEGTVTVAVKDALGKPVKNSEVTLAIIDESVYAIAPENIRDIRTVFFPPSVDRSQFSFNYSGQNPYLMNSGYLALAELYDVNDTTIPVAFVSGILFNERGEKLAGAIVIVNGKYLGGFSNNDGEFGFIVPKGSYNISIVHNGRIYPGALGINLVNAKPNFIQVKVSPKGIEFGELNKTPLQQINPKSTGTGRIYGTVKDNYGNKLFGARIELMGTTLRVGTNESGFYEFENLPGGNYSVKCTYVGYESEIVKGIDVYFYSNEKVNFEMIQGGVVLDTVAILTDRKTMDNGSGKIITSQELDYSTVFLDVNGIENIVAKTSGIVQDERGQEINIRGGRTGETQIIIDGVTTGDYSAEFGDILSGVINITKKGDDEFVEAITRSDFKDAVLWMPAVYTDENGIAKVKVKFPDNLTSWRVTARVLTKQTDVGQITHSIITSKDLIIRVETPRFFQQNDELTVSTIIHNYLDEEKTAKVTMKLDNLELLGSTTGEQLITIGKNEEKRIDWNVKVNDPLGKGIVTATALTNEESDAMQMQAPIQPFGVKVMEYSAFDLTGSSLNRTFEIPEGTDIKSAGVQIGLSPSLASTIYGSLDYLIDYPYGCIEQTMSRFIPAVVAAGTLKELGAPEDPYFAKQLPIVVNKGFDMIYSMQNSDGGWGWWSASGSDPYMSAYVLYGLNLARTSGYKPKNKNVRSAISFLEQKLKFDKLESTTRAFITLVIAESNSEAKDLLNKQFTLLAKKELSSLARAMLAIAATKLLKPGTSQKHITEVMREVNYTDDDKAYWGSKIKKYSWQYDNIITTSLVIKALMSDPVSAKENKDIIDKGVNWLLSQKKGYSWGNTMQTAFIIYSLTDYIKKYNELEPDYNLKVYLNGQTAIEKQITKENLYYNESKFLLTGQILKTGSNELRIEKSGPGKSYLNTALTYYVKDSKKEISETSNGFEVEREYYELKKVFDEKNKVYVYKKSPVNGALTSGAELLVKTRIYPKEISTEYFMLEDPIPAGCEFIKDEWAYAIEGETSYKGTHSSDWNWWYDNREVRDNRIVFFASRMAKEYYEFSYLLRAQIPGTFNVMPPKAMLMYYPEYNGSGENQVIKIVDSK